MAAALRNRRAPLIRVSHSFRRALRMQSRIVFSAALLLGLLVGFEPFAATRTRKASEEKSSEFIREKIESSFRFATSGSSGDGPDASLAPFDREWIVPVTQPETRISVPNRLVIIPFDPRSTWKADLSPPRDSRSS